MSATIISFATQKGGSGKTTLLMLTAVALHNRTDKKILVVDSDPQRSVKEISKQEEEIDKDKKVLRCVRIQLVSAQPRSEL